MTILGKILVFVVLVLSLLWTFLTASTFAARTNWQARSKQYQDEAQKAAEAAKNLKTLLDAEREAATDQVRGFREKADRAEQVAATVQKERDGLLDQYNKLLDSAKKQSAEVAPLLANKEKLIAEVGQKDALIAEQVKRLNELTLSEQQAVVKAAQQSGEAKAQRERANKLADDLQRANEAIATARAGGGGGPARNPGGVRVPAPTGLRGTVTQVDRANGEIYVTINVGLDTNLQQNTELTVSRYAAGQAAYLGKLLITQSDPKQAGGRFILPGGLRPRPDQLPRVGDTVTP